MHPIFPLPVSKEHMARGKMACGRSLEAEDRRASILAVCSDTEADGELSLYGALVEWRGGRARR